MIRSSFLKIFVVAIVCLWIVNPGLGRVHQNLTEIAYNELDSTKSFSKSLSMSSLIENSASSYCKANSDFQLFLKIFELQDIEPTRIDEVLYIVNNSIDNIAMALKSYNSLIVKAENTPYNYDIISSLKNFEYDNFSAKFKLNTDVFGLVKKFLIKGDVTGCYLFSQKNYIDINVKLKTIKSILEEGFLPDNSTVWELNELFAQTSLFGSYVARIFYSLQN